MDLSNLYEKLKLIHYVKTDGAEYCVYNIQTSEESSVSIAVERNKIRILKKEIFEESWGTLGADSFSTFVHHILYHLYEFIKKQNEFIIEDKRI